MNFKAKLLTSTRLTKQLIASVSDFICILSAIIFSFFLFSTKSNIVSIDELLRILWVPTFTVFIFFLFGVYKSVLRYIDFAMLYLLFKAVLTSFTLNLILGYAYFAYISNDETQDILSIRVWIFGLFSSIIFVIGLRLIANSIFSKKKHEKKVIIFGAGSAGIKLAEALKVSAEMQPVAFVDSNYSLQGSYLGGLRIFPPDDLELLVKTRNVDEVLIAIPSASKLLLKNLLKDIEKLSVKTRILPGLSELAQGKISVGELKEVDFFDLLGRSEIIPDYELLNKNIKSKNVLVTGAGGSIGSEISRQVVANKPDSLVLLDTNEFSLFDIKNEIEFLEENLQVYALLGSVVDKSKICEICKTFNIDTIYHTAAYKHVPLVEENPFEGVKNNIFGTRNCLEGAIESEVETFVLISTDKAVRPTNIMGASKRFSELILQAYSSEKNFRNKTRMTMVRFGNVIGSSGSAVPLFQRQIKKGGPVTVTDPEVLRYFMSIPEAAELVIQAGAMGLGGDVFVLDMGEPVKILELAKRLINLSGLELKDEKNPDGDIEIIITGLRSGEKLYEELLIGGNVTKTRHKQILRAEENFISKEKLDKYLDKIKDATKNNDVELLKDIFLEVIDGYTPEENIVDILTLQKRNL
tara:strand:- start:3588 stop:5501 length:1914 start_codon:yes stop_codon:yes gene_type:complete